MEKGDLEPLEKEAVSGTDVNLDRDNKKSVVKSGIESLLNERVSLKVENETSSKYRNSETEVSPSEEITDFSAEINWPTDSRKRKNGSTGSILQYEREFLLSCKDSPLTKTYPTEVEQFPDILVPINLPRLERDRSKSSRRIQPKRDSVSNAVDSQCQSEILSGSDFEGFSNGAADTTASDETEEVLDFDFLLTDDMSSIEQNDNNFESGTDIDKNSVNGNDFNRDLEAGEARNDSEQSVREEMGNVISMGSEQNDLDFDGGQKCQEAIELNIPTDVDDIDAEDEDIPLREYQKELAKEGSEGKNVIVLAPTNTGKTRVACSIMQVHLRRERSCGKIGKVVFLVENEALAFQQGKVCAELLPAYRTKVISGSVQREKKQLLKDFIDRRDILVVTAQVVLNALKRKEISSLTVFSMIVFDECHHTDNLHRFNEIMSIYMDLKLRDNLDASSLPQVIGLSASLGVRGKNDAFAAINHMKGLLANLDAKYLCTVKENIEELTYYENNPKEEIVTAENRQEDRFREAILHIIEKIDHYMKTHKSMAELPEKDMSIKIASQVPPSRGTEQFQQWLSVFREAIARVRFEPVGRMLNPCRLHLEVYNKALLIHADARIKDARAILEEFMEQEMEIEPEIETDKMLTDLYKDLRERDFSNEPENPKLLEMKKLLLKELGNNEDARGIVFVKSRELARALIRWMNDVEILKTLNAREFVGQAATAAQGGMTKCGQKDVLEYFKNGHHKVIVATSVAEEGLDITKCNLVIRYEYVTNEIVRLQSRGRARAKNSKYYVLTTEGSWIVEKEEKNAMLERLMNVLVPTLQTYIKDNPDDWEEESRHIQEKQKILEERKQEQLQAKKSNDDVEFRCLNCSQFICMSSDIRTIQGAHHIVINKDVHRRLVSRRGRNPVVLHDDIESRGVIFCGDPKCQRVLGGICDYRRVEFPLIKIKHFKVVDRNGERDFIKKWKKADFEIQQFNLEDLRQVVRMRRSTCVAE